MNKIITVSQEIQYFKPVTMDFQRIPEVTCSKNYSPVRYINNIRNTANFLSADSCILDFDGTVTLEAAKRMFAVYKAIIVTTKSHQMSSKNGKEIERLDRFRVIIPFDKTITELNIFESVMKNVTRYFNSDEACVDGARFYYPNPYQTTWISSGEKLIDTSYYVAAPTKGHVNDKTTILKRSDIALQGDIDITDKTNRTLPASSWADTLDADMTVTVYCPNPKHADVHPSAFIKVDKFDSHKIFVWCHVCGAVGTYPKQSSDKGKGNHYGNKTH